MAERANGVMRCSRNGRRSFQPNVPRRGPPLRFANPPQQLSMPPGTVSLGLPTNPPLDRVMSHRPRVRHRVPPKFTADSKRQAEAAKTCVPLPAASCLLPTAGCRLWRTVRQTANRLGPARRAAGRHGPPAGHCHRPARPALHRGFHRHIQVYDTEGKYLGQTWTTPDFRNGRPSGLSIDRDGHLILADSHYHCFRIYDADGNELPEIRRRNRPRAGAVQLYQRRGARFRRFLLRFRIWRKRAHHEIGRGWQSRQMLGRQRHRTGPVQSHSRWRSGRTT